MSTFALQLAEFAEKVGNNADQVFRQVSTNVLAKVVKRSPVGLPEVWAINEGKKRGDKGFVGAGYIGGRFKGNWVMTTGVPDLSTKDAVDADGGPTISRESARIAPFKLGESVYIMNNLPYAQRLENGYSQQAPVGMVKITVAEFQSLVENAAKEVAK